MKNLIYISLLPLILMSCNLNDNEADAWGNFESNEILISAESNGKILSMRVYEGDKVSENDLIAVIDTASVNLQLNELKANRSTINTRLLSVEAQDKIFAQQMENLEINIDRVRNMLKDKAATQKQLDDLTGQMNVLKRQKEANLVQKAIIMSELNVLSAKRDLLEEQLQRSYVRCPAKGTVLEKYAEKGEITTMGKPLIKIADLANMELKVYISGAQLADVRIGDDCKVRIDNGEKDYHEYSGRVIHISDKAEFTPKIIQTKEERVHMVYAVTILVKNDGSLKNGMPAEVLFE